MPEGSEAGGMPAAPPSSDGGIPGSTPPGSDPDGGTPPGQSTQQPGRGSPGDPAVELRTALDAERKERKRLEAETKRLQGAIESHADAGKSEAERERARAEREAARANEAEAKLAAKETETLARQVAAEAGVAHLWAWLKGSDLRELRADATRLREAMGMQGGPLDGGVRGRGVPQGQEMSMDDLIREGVRRR